MVCILFVLQLQRYKIILDFCYILQSFLYSILHFITLLQRVGNFSKEYIKGYNEGGQYKRPLFLNIDFIDLISKYDADRDKWMW